MTRAEEKSDLLRYLAEGRDAVIWKLDGLSDYDIRRPLVPSGTNLLGLLKHVASVEAEYLGLVFDRPFDVPLPWLADDAEDNADLWATADQSRDWLVDFYRRVADHSTATVEALPLDATGMVPWWPAASRQVRLHQILVHVIAETHRHAGHMDLCRELVDGARGLRADNSNLPDQDNAWWQGYRDRLENLARDADPAHTPEL